MSLISPKQKADRQGLYTIADNTFSLEKSHLELAKAYLEGGGKIVQLRVKEGNVEGTAREIMDLKRDFDFTFIVNDFVEVAKRVKADGVHVGRYDMPIRRVREIIGKEMLIGYSAHSLEEALEAEKAGADYCAFGAIFPSKTKGPGHPVQGLEKLRAVVKAVNIPVVAIGGINRKNFRSVLEAGPAAISMITALTQSPDSAKETRYFVDRI